MKFYISSTSRKLENQIFFLDRLGSTEKLTGCVLQNKNACFGGSSLVY